MNDDTQSMDMDTAAQPPVQPAGPAQQPPVPVPMQPPAQQAPVVPAQQDPLESHPAVQNASILRKVAEKIAGGDRIKTTYNPEDGSVKRERVPLSGSQMLMGILANVLGGAGHIASNESARMRGQATNQNFQLPTQVAQQQQDTQAREDYDQQQQAKVRKAQILKANMEAMRTAYSIGQENDEQKDKIVSNHADDLAQWSNTGAVQDNNVPSDQLMQRGYDPSKYIAVPDGKVAVFKQDGSRATDSNGVPISQLTYSVIDGTTQAPLSQSKFDKLVQYGLQKQGAGSTIPEGATISSAVLAQMNHKIDLIDQTQNELDKAIGPGKVNVLDKIKENPGLIKAIEAYHNDGSSTEVDNQINNLQAKNPQAAGLMRSLVGKDVLEKLKETREARAAGAKSGEEAKQRAANEPINPNNAATILADPNASPEKKTQAQKVLDTDVTFAARKAYADAQARKSVEQTQSLSDVDQLAQNIVAGDVIATMTDISSYRQSERMRLSNAIVKEAKAQGKNPEDFAPAKLKAKADVIKDFGSGKAADQLVAFNTFLGHADDAMNANANWRRTNSPLINKPMNWLATNATNDQNFQQFQESLVPVQKEFMGFLNANRAEHESDIKQMDTILSDKSTPAQIETSLKALGNSADIRLAQLGRKYSNTIGQAYPTLISPEGQQALQKMGIKSRAVVNAQNPAQGQQPIYAKNPQTNARVVSNDGGKTWQPVP